VGGCQRLKGWIIGQGKTRVQSKANSTQQAHNTSVLSTTIPSGAAPPVNNRPCLRQNKALRVKVFTDASILTTVLRSIHDRFRIDSYIRQAACPRTETGWLVEARRPSSSSDARVNNNRRRAQLHCNPERHQAHMDACRSRP